MNYQDIVFFDFETTSVNPHTCQPIQLAALIIDGRKLEIRENSLFNSYIRPIFEQEDCEKLQLDPLTPKITELTGITEETLLAAPSVKIVWEQFVQYINTFNPKKNKWGAPIKAGMNIDSYDIHIVNRLCGGHMRHKQKTVVEPYGFGDWDDNREESTLFYPRDSIDLMRLIWFWTENMPDIKSISMSSMRDWLGISAEGAHNAIKDVQDGAEMLIRFLNLHRRYAPKVKFKGSFAKKENADE